MATETRRVSGAPQLVAHRGNAHDLPENTLPALQSAVELGARFIEFDVQLAADGVPMVIHDAELERTLGLSGTVFERSSTELAALTVKPLGHSGVALTRLSDPIRVPTLQQVVDFIAAHAEVTAFVEIKRASLRHFGQETVLARILDVLRPVHAQCVVISFDLAVVYAARSAGYPIGWVLTAYDEHEHFKCEALQPEFLFCNHEKLPPDGSRLWRGPWRWALYEVETPALAMALHARGADLVETMRVADLASLLKSRDA